MYTEYSSEGVGNLAERAVQYLADEICFTEAVLGGRERLFFAVSSRYL